jgi:hypothetical protein
MLMILLQGTRTACSEFLEYEACEPQALAGNILILNLVRLELKQTGGNQNGDRDGESERFL